MNATSRIMIAGLLVLASGLASIADDAGAAAQSQIELAGRAFGTSYSIKVAAPTSAVSTEELQHRVDTLIAEIDVQMSLWREDSELSRFNAYDGIDWFEVSAETAEVVAASIDLSHASEGAFDPTVSPLVELWNFGPRHQPVRLPTKSELEQARSHVGIDLIEVRREPPAIRKRDPQVRLDLNAIAKGDAVDRVASLLDGVAATGSMVEIGGEIRTRGTKADGSLWSIGIERPVAGRRMVQSVVKLSDAAMATSGDYRNFVEVDGQRFSHTIDPRTGRPIDHRLASVSVVADDCMSADAWATALMVLGPEEGFRLAEAQGVRALFLSHSSEGFEARSTTGFPLVKSPVEPTAAAWGDAGSWGTFLIAAIVFGVAIAGMSVGVILSNRRIRGSCGGLDGLKDERGNPLCDACTQPAEECRELRDQIASQEEAHAHQDASTRS